MQPGHEDTPDEHGSQGVAYTLKPGKLVTQCSYPPDEHGS